jgi:hypothetical protein
MRRSAKWFLAAAAVVAVGRVQAQNQPNQQPPNQQQGRFTSNPFDIYTEPRPQTIRNVYTWDPYSGYLQGVASVIQSQGQFAIDQQTVRLKNEQVNAARLVNRRNRLEQWLWEREHLPTNEDDRQRVLRQEIGRARMDPPITEIWSGKALNDLLTDLRRVNSPGAAPSGTTAIPTELLEKINITSGKAGGNLGVIRDGKVWWPLILRRSEFDTLRTHFDDLLAKAVSQAQAGQPISADVLEMLIQRQRDLSNALTDRARKLGDGANWSPLQYSNAKSFLNQVNDAMTVLQQADAADFLGGKLAAKGRTVNELVQHMKDNGLFFAPATPGKETAYTALHRKLADYSTEAGMQLPPPK